MPLHSQPAGTTNLNPDVIDRRVSFQLDDQIFEIDLSDLKLENSADVNLLYDRLEAMIAESGEAFWYFLINYRGTRIDPAAWLAHSRRGKSLNQAHSQGTVRYDASDETRRQIEASAGTENFNPNLFADREEAIKRLKSFPSKRVATPPKTPSYEPGEFSHRVRFLEAEEIMDVDLTNITFVHSRDVNDCYDELENKLRPTGRKWYFLVNYENTKIFSEAWIQYSSRGKALNKEFSLGSVRFAPGLETETDIRLRAESGGFRPNIRNTRAEALARIDEIKRGE
jgi:hypothetical protein